MSSHERRQKFVLGGIILAAVSFYLYYTIYSEKHDFLTAVIGHPPKLNPNKVLKDSTVNFTSLGKDFSNLNKGLNGSTVNFASEAKGISNLNKGLNGSTVNFTSEAKGISNLSKPLNAVPKFPAVSRIPDRGNVSLEEKNQILKLINIFNAEQRIHNSETFGPVTNGTFVVAIQVHFRFEYLELLLQSLADAEGINDSLLIFSHDVYSPEMNGAIQQINFTRILQIFLPITGQNTSELYLGKTWGLTFWKIMGKTYANQHWWWKANFLFNKVSVLSKYEGVIHFLEEDDYVITDYIAVMKKLEVLMRENNCFGCNVLVAGHRLYGSEIRTSWKSGTHNVAIVSDLDEPTVNRGLAFNRTLWKKIKACEKIFCDTYRDGNWDSTLMDVSMGCMNSSRLTVLAPEAPRLFHVGDCGMHHRSKVCNPLPRINVIKKYIQQFSSVLFPDKINLSLEFIKRKGSRRRPARNGWYERDSKLCLSLGVYGQVPSLFNNSIL